MSIKKSRVSLDQQERIGLFGGTFDPIHLGHTIIAEWMLHNLNLEKVYFIPNYIHPFQKRNNITPNDMRFQMLSLALKNYPKFEISTFEIDGDNTSYAIDTIIYFKELYPGNDLFYIIGKDNISDFHKWKEPEEIFRLAEVVVFNRKEVSQAQTVYSKKFVYTDSPIIEISSSFIRKSIKTNKPFQSLLHPSVYEFIRKDDLYL